MQTMTDAPMHLGSRPGPQITIVGLNSWALQHIRDATPSRRNDLHLLLNPESELPVQEYRMPYSTTLVERAQCCVRGTNDGGTWVFLALYSRSDESVPESVHTTSQIERIMRKANAWPIEE
ncbi:MAG: hypothetical protein A3B30_03145 [Candidatus Komeilibacteria bacterium RIFCSPLOWO2_01_FULL_52_15]|uniref:Uncharacterized protein n=2 Tax=Candidatus Komeiliibacteriota TaxID=1817908 RepID=A0A1G2BQH1_9BACT|nr:MAG: hypothetical protein A2677_03580 [Candidatus Komeilibacteria bacterium RIFCSPHIGHO2_01_FULL_52_14]OGY90447.1 MAG: hypothetical protein A3B30_03145 [Candidatus Komeilibacteria bacterium RIFCSPLOWO2_01_FULL_52_15]